MMFWHTFFVIGNPDAEQRTRYTRYKRPCRLPPRACNDFFPGISLKGESVNRIRAIRAPWQRQKQLLWVSGCGPSRNEPLSIHEAQNLIALFVFVCSMLFFVLFLPSYVAETQHPWFKISLNSRQRKLNMHWNWQPLRWGNSEQLFAVHQHESKVHVNFR